MLVSALLEIGFEARTEECVKAGAFVEDAFTRSRLHRGNEVGAGGTGEAPGLPVDGVVAVFPVGRLELGVAEEAEEYNFGALGAEEVDYAGGGIG